MKVALQLYSIRELCEKDFFAALEDVKKIGYDGVEFAGYFGKTAEELKAKLDELGLEAAGSHVGFDAIENNLDEVIKYSKTLGLYSVVCPGTSFDSLEKIKHASEVFNRAGEAFAKEGIVFGYHNHAHEFVQYDGEYGLDILYKNTNPQYVTAEIDTYWVKKGGEDPVSYCKKYSDRMYLLHAKDMYEDGKDSNVGEGCIDFASVIKELPLLKWAIVEQEAFEGDMLECVKKGCDNLKKLK